MILLTEIMSIEKKLLDNLYYRLCSIPADPPSESEGSAESPSEFE